MSKLHFSPPKEIMNLAEPESRNLSVGLSNQYVQLLVRFTNPKSCSILKLNPVPTLNFSACMKFRLKKTKTIVSELYFSVIFIPQRVVTNCFVNQSPKMEINSTAYPFRVAFYSNS